MKIIFDHKTNRLLLTSETYAEVAQIERLYSVMASHIKREWSWPDYSEVVLAVECVPVNHHAKEVGDA